MSKIELFLKPLIAFSNISCLFICCSFIKEAYYMLSPLMTYKRFSKHNKSLILNFKLLLLISNKGNDESCSLDGCLNYVCLIVSFIVKMFYQSGTTESF